jgi:acetyl-CoA synthetase
LPTLCTYSLAQQGPASAPRADIDHLASIKPLQAFATDVIEAPAHYPHFTPFVEGKEQYEEMYKRSIEDPNGFWADIASEFYWQKKVCVGGGLGAGLCP